MKLLLLLFVSVLAYNYFPLKDILELTFHNEVTTSNKTKDKNYQLICIGGNAFRQNYRIQTVFCKNNNFNWSCNSNLDHELKLENLNVICERHEENTTYILRGSCYLEYTLEYVDNNYNNTVKGYHNIILIFLLTLWFMFILNTTKNVPIGPMDKYVTRSPRTQ